MLDLKAKLLAAGLVTAEQVKKVEEQQKPKAKREGSAHGPVLDKRDENERWRKRLEELRGAPKSEVYDAIRAWVTRHRIDNKTALPSEQAVRFHFQRADDTIGHLTVEPDVQAKLSAGEAGLIAFMGNNGLEHAVVPADLARDIATLKPEWLRSLATP